MNTTQTTEAFEAQIVLCLMANITLEVMKGSFPTAPRRWNDVHDHVDANWLGLESPETWVRFCSRYENEEAALNAMARINSTIQDWLQSTNFMGAIHSWQATPLLMNCLRGAAAYRI